MVTLHEVITFLVSMQISISSLQTHNVNRCGRSRHLARKLSLRRKRSSPNVFEMAATETITRIILINVVMVSLDTVRNACCIEMQVISVQITLDLFFTSIRRHTIFDCDWSSDVCSSDLRPRIPWLPSNFQIGTFNDLIGDTNERANGNAVLRIDYSDGSQGILGLGCEGPGAPEGIRSEERRVGKESRSRWSPCH